MSRVWLMSDLHVGHKSICKYREEFSSPEEHHQTMIDNMLSSCGKRDTLWLLGDVCFDESYAWMYKLACESIGYVHLVLGNHCTENTERQAVVKYAITQGVKVHGLSSYKGAWLSHAPLHPEELRGKVNIHGHMHRSVIDDWRYMNVCVEHTNWKPIQFADVKEEFARRKNKHANNN